MKRWLLILAFEVFVYHLSFAQDLCQEGECFSATISGAPFKFRDYWPANAILYRQQGSLDGRQPRQNVISIVLSGESYVADNGKQFDESIQFEIAYEENMLGEPCLYTVSLHYRSGVYSVIKNQRAFIITGFSWEPDHRSFRISADIDCVLYRWGYPLDGSEDVTLSAKFSNVLITVPAWIASAGK